MSARESREIRTDEGRTKELGLFWVQVERECGREKANETEVVADCPVDKLWKPPKAINQLRRVIPISSGKEMRSKVLADAIRLRESNHDTMARLLTVRPVLNCNLNANTDVSGLPVLHTGNMACVSRSETQMMSHNSFGPFRVSDRHGE